MSYGNNGTTLKVFKRDRYTCCFCGNSPATDSTIELHIDHIIPLSRGGKDSIENLRTLCHRCNLQKNNKTDFDALIHSYIVSVQCKYNIKKIYYPKQTSTYRQLRLLRGRCVVHGYVLAKTYDKDIYHCSSCNVRYSKVYAGVSPSGIHRFYYYIENDYRYLLQGSYCPLESKDVGRLPYWVRQDFKKMGIYDEIIMALAMGNFELDFKKLRAIFSEFLNKN